MIKRLISGAQTGADLAGLLAAEKHGIPTGGWMPKRYKNQAGNFPEYAKRFSIQEHASPAYPPRTEMNVKESDGTIRFASDFESAGEKLTLKLIQKHNKPSIDVNVFNPISSCEVVSWIIENKIETLNVAGNSERTSMGITLFVTEYLEQVFQTLDEKLRQRQL